jgi:hypothetical protein
MRKFICSEYQLIYNATIVEQHFLRISEPQHIIRFTVFKFYLHLKTNIRKQIMKHQSHIIIIKCLKNRSYEDLERGRDLTGDRSEASVHSVCLQICDVLPSLTGTGAHCPVLL